MGESGVGESGGGESVVPESGAGLVAELARGLLTGAALDQIESDSAAQIVDIEPAYQAVGVVVREIRRATRSTLSLALARVAGATVSDEVEAAPHAIGRLRAEQGVPLAAVLHAFRLDFRVLWDALVVEGRQAGVTDQPEFIDGSKAVWSAVEAITEEVVQAYRERERELDHSRVDERERALADLLGRGGTEPAISARSAMILGLPNNGRFTIVVGAINSDDRECINGLLTTLTRLGVAAHFGGPADDVRGIIDTSTLPEETLRPMLDVLAAGRFGVASVTGAIGNTARAARLALAAAETLVPTERGVAHVDDRWLPAILQRDPELAGAFAARTLGGVLELPEVERRRLLSTLWSYLSGPGSMNDLAETQYLHRNTIRKRLARVEALTGRSLMVPRDITELTLAVTWVQATTGITEAPE